MAEGNEITLRSPRSGCQYVSDMSSRLGTGAFSTVRRAETLVARTAVAVKMFPRAHFNEEMVTEEIRIMRATSASGGHPNVLKILDVVQTSGEEAGDFAGRSHIVIELCDYPLCTMARKNRVEPFLYRHHPLVFKMELTRQLLSGLAHIHKNKFCHNDIHFANFMVHKTSGMVKFIDFGIADEDQNPPSRSDIFHRISDMHGLAKDILLPIWCCEKFGVNSTDAQNHVKESGVYTEEMVERANRYIKEYGLAYGLYGQLRDDLDWYRKESDIMKKCIHELFEYFFSANEEAGSDVIPVGLRRPFELCMLFGKFEHLTSTFASELVEEAVSQYQQNAGVEYIREWAQPADEVDTIDPDASPLF
eukprot:scpid82626/ scgid18130/ Serine/threonine-protein kinase BUR1